jgi:hypothetical protein
MTHIAYYRVERFVLALSGALLAAFGVRGHRALRCQSVGRTSDPSEQAAASNVLRVPRHAAAVALGGLELTVTGPADARPIIGQNWRQPIREIQ